jgi:phosphoribosylglycinamide formyltransferase-1
MSEPLNIAVFASGRGTNFRAILSAVQAAEIPNTVIALVISNNSEAGALAIARENIIPALHISQQQFPSENEFVKTLLDTLETHHINFIALAGYMKKLPSLIIRRFRNRIINIHPALLPKYGGTGMYGKHVHEAVIANRETLSGATVHIVDEEYDHGAIVLQETVSVSANDTPETLAEKVLEIEHRLYPEALRLFAEGKVSIEGQHVRILEHV